MITIPEILLHHNLQFFRQAVLAISSILSTGGQWGQLRGLLNRKEHKRLQQVHLLSASFCSWLYPLRVEVQIQITSTSNCKTIKNHVFCPHPGGGETMDRCGEKEITLEEKPGKTRLQYSLYTLLHHFISALCFTQQN